MRVNGEDLDTDVTNVASLLKELGIDPRGVAVARNGEVLRRGEWETVAINNTDIIEIVTAAAGGM